MPSMVLLGDESQVEARLNPFRDSANLDATPAWLVPNVPLAHKSFGRTWWNSWVTWVIWNLASFRLETLLVRCNIVAWFAVDIP